jgi:hypothetical protein
MHVEAPQRLDHGPSRFPGRSRKLSRGSLLPFVIPSEGRVLDNVVPTQLLVECYEIERYWVREGE